jgi:energy-coupling factor transport system permease protein
MIRVLAGDARRRAEAQRTRPDDACMGARERTRARVRLLSAIVGSSLDRAMDVAATLELRGFAEARRARRRTIPWSRHDIAFAASAVSLAALALGARFAGVAAFDAYPEIQAGSSPEALALGVALCAVILLPFLDRRGIEP